MSFIVNTHYYVCCNTYYYAHMVWASFCFHRNSIFLSEITGDKLE